MTTAAPDPRWAGKDGLFGGYVVAWLVDAAVASCQHRLVSHATSFVSKVAVAEAHVDLTVLHAGRSTTVNRTTLVQEGRARAHASAELVARSDPPRHLRTTVTPPLPSPAPDTAAALPFHQLLDVRPCGSPELRGEGATWVRWRVPPADVGVTSAEGALAVLLDTPTPGLFGEPAPPVFVPTIDYTLHFAPLPVDDAEVGGWTYLTHATAWATSDHCVDEAQAWTADGRLLAQVRQTRGVRWT